MIPARSGQDGHAGPMESRWISTVSELTALVAELRDEPVFALDTEFHGERTYYPLLALVQCAWSSGIALVDPLAVDVAPLGQLLIGPGLMVSHAGEQDLAIIERATGAVPLRLFDTQVAAGFCGLGQPGLGELVRRVLGIELAKGDQLTDWTRRPLDRRQRAYAAADVEHLLALHEELAGRLRAAGRLEWALDECDELRTRDRSPRDPATAWWRIKGSRRLRGKARGVAQTVGAWRERTARSQDLPPRFVLPELALAGIVQRTPHTDADLRKIRGLDARHLREGKAAEILAALAEGQELPTSALRLPPDGGDLDRSLQPAVTLLLAWCNQLAASLDLAPALLATRADLVEFLRARRGRLAHGWRHDLVAEPIEHLLAGSAAIGLADSGRRIELIDRAD